MNIHDPYQAPTSDVSQERLDKTYQPYIFSTSGRIGRLRYTAYLFFSYLFAIPFAIVVSAMSVVSNETEPGEITGAVFTLLLVSAYIAIFVFNFALAKRRFNDLGVSGWFSLLLIVPLVNLFLGLWLLFGPGQRQSNRFGRAPNKNPVSVVICGFVIPLMTIAAVAAVFIPAYQDYVERAETVQSILTE